MQKSEKRPNAKEGEPTELLTFDEFHPMLFKQYEKRQVEEFESFNKVICLLLLFVQPMNVYKFVISFLATDIIIISSHINYFDLYLEMEIHCIAYNSIEDICIKYIDGSMIITSLYLFIYLFLFIYFW